MVALALMFATGELIDRKNNFMASSRYPAVPELLSPGDGLAAHELATNCCRASADSTCSSMVRRLLFRQRGLLHGSHDCGEILIDPLDCLARVLARRNLCGGRRRRHRYR